MYTIWDHCALLIVFILPFFQSYFIAKLELFQGKLNYCWQDSAYYVVWLAEKCILCLFYIFHFHVSSAFIAEIFSLGYKDNPKLAHQLLFIAFPPFTHFSNEIYIHLLIRHAIILVFYFLINLLFILAAYKSMFKSLNDDWEPVADRV